MKVEEEKKKQTNCFPGRREKKKLRLIPWKQFVLKARNNRSVGLIVFVGVFVCLCLSK